MSRRDRITLAVVIVAVAVVSLVGAAIAATLTDSGVIVVNIREGAREETDIRIALPAGPVLMAMHFVPNCCFDEVPAEALRYMGVARELCDVLSEQPDFTLVEVEGRGETVLVRKEGKNLVVRVDEDDTSIFVSVPLGAVEKVAKKLEKGRIIL